MPDELPDEVGAPEATQTQDQPDTDWQKRFTDTQAWGNTLNEQVSKLREDPDAVIDFLREHHPELLADEEPEPEWEPEPEPEYQDDPTADLRARVERFEAWQQAQMAQQSQAEFNRDLNEVLGDRKVSQKGEGFIRYTRSQGNIRDAKDLEKAVDGWFEYVESLAPKPQPRVPHAVTAGQAATGVPDWDSMTPGEINKYLTERVRSNEAQT